MLFKKIFFTGLALSLLIMPVLSFSPTAIADSPKKENPFRKLRYPGDVVVTSPDSSTKMISRTEEGIITYQTTITAPFAGSDLNPIDCNWSSRVDDSGQTIFSSGKNLFTVKAVKNKITVLDNSGSLYTWTSNLSSGEYYLIKDTPQIVEDIFHEYGSNCLQWEYTLKRNIVDSFFSPDSQFIRRYLRLTEGTIKEYWVIDQNPGIDISVSVTEYKESSMTGKVSSMIAFDSSDPVVPIPLKEKMGIKENTYTLKKEDFLGKTYPIYLDPSLSMIASTDGYSFGSTVYAGASVCSPVNGYPLGYVGASKCPGLGTNYPSSSIVRVGYTSIAGGQIFRGFLSFNTDILPDDAVISSAYIQLYQITPGAGTIYVFHDPTRVAPHSPPIIEDYNAQNYTIWQTNPWPQNSPLCYAAGGVSSCPDYPSFDSQGGSVSTGPVIFNLWYTDIYGRGPCLSSNPYCTWTYEQMAAGCTYISRTERTAFVLYDRCSAIGRYAYGYYTCSNTFSDFYSTSSGPDSNYKPQLVVTFNSSSSSPTVTTDSATGVLVQCVACLSTSATLHATVVDDGGSSCSVSFQYGTSSGVYPYTSSSMSGVTGEHISIVISGLSKGVKYYFRAKSINSGFTSYGSEMSFLTSPDFPINQTATPATNSINLSWTKGVASVRTMIRYRTDTYPTTVSDGTEIYLNTGTSYSHTNLTPQTIYYYSFWGEVTSGGLQSFSCACSAAHATSTPQAVDSPPTITTESATNIQTTSATINGYLTSSNQHSGIVSLSFDSSNISLTPSYANTGGDSIATDGLYTVHTFTTVGTNNFVAANDGSASILVLAGGGGGGMGGGGAGGVYYNGSYFIGSGSHTIIVGDGGDPGRRSSSGQSGESSSFDNKTSLGGGGGGSPSYYSTSGGSGGGGGVSYAPGDVGGSATQPGSSTGGFGYAGGKGWDSSHSSAGGGGGAGGVGENATELYGGSGGLGKDYDIVSSGSNVYYASGGGGGIYIHGQQGHSHPGGGGDASSVDTDGENGSPNTGGGGGGFSYSTGYPSGGKGGSGVVIARCLTSDFVAGGGSTTPSSMTYDQNGSFTLTATGLLLNTQYSYRAKAVGLGGTSYGEYKTFTTGSSYSSPIVVTDNATSIGDTSFTMNGHVSDDGDHGTISGYFEYGPTLISSPNVTGFEIGDNFSYILTGLTPLTTYQYRAVGSNPEGEGRGEMKTVTTLATINTFAPTVSTGLNNTIGSVTSTITGTLTYDGELPCETRFEYGLTDSYGSTTGWQTGKVTGDTFESIIQGLTIGSTYHFRAVAKNDIDTAYGSDVTFTTAFDSPSNLTVKATSSTAVSLTWTPGGEKTLIRISDTNFPIDRTEGEEIYFGSEAKTHWVGLTEGQTYYFSAWSWREEESSVAVWSIDYDEDAVTLPASSGSPLIFQEFSPTIEQDPSMYQSENNTRLQMLPFYSIINDAATDSGIPSTTVWFVVMMGVCLATAACASALFGGNAWIFVGTALVSMWAASLTTAIPWWVALLSTILGVLFILKYKEGGQ